MKKDSYSVNTYWDKRYPLKNTKQCPIQLAVNLEGLQFRISLGLYATEEEYKKVINGKGGTLEIKELRSEINKHYNKALTILETIPNLTREKFQRLFKSEIDLKRTKTDVTLLFNEYLDQLRKEERIKTAENYECALSSFKKYKSSLSFEDIDEAFLRGYSTWMQQRGNSLTTAQMYLRALRVIFNQAIKEGYISKKKYPFENFTIGTSAKSKDVLYPDEIKKFYDYSPKSHREHRAKDMFMFCFLCNGINGADLFYLKNKNIQGDYIIFVRRKTRRTSSISNKEIKAFLHPELKRIIADWRSKSRKPDDFLFPYLHGCDTAEKMEKRRKEFHKQINRKLVKIGRELGFNVRLTLNLARHSFGTTLKLNETPVAFITDLLGHADGKTTQHYLKSLPNKMIEQVSKSLLNFGNDKTN